MKPGSMKFDPLHFGWFDLHLDPFFEEIMNLNTEMPILASSTCYTQNGDWGTRRGSGDSESGLGNLKFPLYYLIWLDW